MILKNQEKENSPYLIEEYVFQNFHENELSDEVKDYHFGDFKDYEEKVTQNLKEPTKREYQATKENGFIVSPLVENYRGLKKRAKEEYQEKIDKAVLEKLEEVKKEYVLKGYDHGKKEAYDEVMEMIYVKTENSLSQLEAMVQEILQEKSKLIKEQEKQIYQLIKKLLVWFLRRELHGDGEYILRSLDSILEEIKKSDSLFIKINTQSIKDVPEAVQTIKDHLKGWKNVRIEYIENDADVGISVESDEEVIESTLHAHKQTIDEIFSKYLDDTEISDD